MSNKENTITESEGAALVATVIRETMMAYTHFLKADVDIIDKETKKPIGGAILLPRITPDEFKEKYLYPQLKKYGITFETIELPIIPEQENGKTDTGNKHSG